jgi:hypothetical protein
MTGFGDDAIRLKNGFWAGTTDNRQHQDTQLLHEGTELGTSRHAGVFG